MNKVFLNETANESDVRCVLLGRLGFSYKAIRQQTGLTASQVGYRFNKLGMRLDDYRNGHSELSKRIINAAHIDSAGIATKIRKMIADSK